MKKMENRIAIWPVFPALIIMLILGTNASASYSSTSRVEEGIVELLDWKWISPAQKKLTDMEVI